MTGSGHVGTMAADVLTFLAADDGDALRPDGPIVEVVDGRPRLR